MKDFLVHKEKHLKKFADLMYAEYVQQRYGIQTKRPLGEEELIVLRKQCAEWQSHDDGGALSQVNMTYKTYLPIQYSERDGATHAPAPASFGPGYYCASNPIGPTGMGSGFSYNVDGNNIIQVNAGGCITRINLTPAINYNQIGSFQYTQATAATLWTITHNMNFNPNVRIEDAQGNDIQGTITYVNGNQLTISFNQPVAGTAYLS